MLVMAQKSTNGLKVTWAVAGEHANPRSRAAAVLVNNLYIWRHRLLVPTASAAHDPDLTPLTGSPVTGGGMMRPATLPMQFFQRALTLQRGPTPEESKISAAIGYLRSR